MYNLDEVYMKEKLLPALEKVTEEVFHTFKSLSLDDFFARPKNKWSAADTLRHLTKSVKALIFALRVPKVFLAAFFGVSSGPSRQYLEIKEAYLKSLAGGAQSGRYAPSFKEIPHTTEEALRFRRKVIRNWKKTGKSLIKILRRWTNHELDKYQLPHPMLGKLTVREMLLFTLYHDLHHMNSVRKRLHENRPKKDHK